MSSTKRPYSSLVTPDVDLDAFHPHAGQPGRPVPGTQIGERAVANHRLGADEGDVEPLLSLEQPDQPLVGIVERAFARRMPLGSRGSSSRGTGRMR